jgi:hypothetical protein
LDMVERCTSRTSEPQKGKYSGTMTFIIPIPKRNHAIHSKQRLSSGLPLGGGDELPLEYHSITPVISGRATVRIHLLRQDGAACYIHLLRQNGCCLP